MDFRSRRIEMYLQPRRLRAGMCQQEYPSCGANQMGAKSPKHSIGCQNLPFTGEALRLPVWMQNRPHLAPQRSIQDPVMQAGSPC
jgi:hypothetical protein